jgi:hypothetical protein
MSLDKQIEKTKTVVEGGVSLFDNSSKLILENQLVILETLKKLLDNTSKRDRSQFGPG